MRLIVLLTLFFFSYTLNGQISFHQNDQLISQDYHSNISIGVTDMNGDLLDDIVFLDEGKKLVIAYQGVQNGSFSVKEYEFETGIAQWSMTVGDINSDNRLDILMGGAYDESKLLSQTIDRSDFALSESFNDDCFIQGSNTMDINNDGWLDYFVCDDDAASRIFVNDGTGQLVRNDLIDFQTIPASDNSGNYGSEWVDVNGDDLLDLYIAKCRAGVNSPSDPRRINALYINNGDGTFTERAGDYGLKIGDQSWSSSFGDMDNDGDFDCLIANHGSPHLMLENDSNTSFESINFYSEDLISTAFQSLWSDFDNDGFVDALIVGSEAHLLHNRGDKTFKLIRNPFGGVEPNSMALGDLNDDGFIDVYTNFGQGINSPGNNPDRIYINEANDNNYVRFSLKGTDSNINAVGAKLKIYGEWGVQVRQVRAGESYGIFNSLTQHFGLGQAEMIDSLVVIWPNAIKQTFDSILPNNTYHIKEGSCLTNRISIDESLVILCDPLETYTIEAPAGFEKYEWNNGAEGNSIVVAEEGTYVVNMESTDGCLTISRPVSILYNPDIPISYSQPETAHKCSQDTIILQAPQGYDYQWNDGSISSFLEVYSGGTYSVEMNLWCGKTVEKIFMVNQTTVTPPNVEGDDILIGETATITSDISEVTWCDESGLVIGEGAVLTIEGLIDTTTYYCSAYEENYNSNSVLSAPNTNPNNLYSAATINSGLRFDVLSPIILNQFMVETDTPGERVIVILDADDIEIYRQVYDLSIGINTIILNFKIPQGTGYRITTDETVNFTNLGQISPQLVRSSDALVNYPYTIANSITITSSINGPNYYYYFYNWNIDHDYMICESEKVEAVVNVRDPNGTDDFDLGDAFILHPNPSLQGLITLEYNGDDVLFNAKYKISNVQGQQILQGTLNKFTTVDLTQLRSGLYYVNLIDEKNGRQGIKKLVILK